MALHRKLLGGVEDAPRSRIALHSICIVRLIAFQLVPSSIGGDGIRFLAHHRACARWSEAANGIILDRMFGIVAHLHVRIAGIMLLYERVAVLDSGWSAPILRSRPSEP